jgi:LPXTG-motif cell wall-anchored protein
VSGLEPQESAIVAQCPAGQGPSDACAQTRYVYSEFGGDAQTAIRLQRFIGPDSSPVDCADPGACELVTRGFANPFHVDAAPLDFDPAAPPRPGPTLVVTPDTDLVHQQVVSVTGSGFLPNVSVSVFECTATEECGFTGDHFAFPTSDADGNIETTFEVQRGVRLGDASLFDCVDPPGCELHARENIETDYQDGGATAMAPIAFDASIPPPPPPVVIADPPGPYADRQIVSLTADGFAPNDMVFALQCVGDGAALSNCQGFRTLFADASGTVHTALRVHRLMETFGDAGAGVAETVDCAFDVCSLVLASFNDVFDVGATPLVIDPTAPPVAPPMLVVDPNVDLDDGQVVSVRGSGFTPGGAVIMVECVGGAPDETGRKCDLPKTLKTATVHDDGTIDTTFTVRRTLNTNAFGTVDCATVADGCILGWAGGDRPFEQGNVPLHFAGHDLEGDSLDGGGLPRTGTNSTSLAAWGALALATGVVLRVVTRRRRRAADVLPD